MKLGDIQVGEPFKKEQVAPLVAVGQICSVSAHSVERLVDVAHVVDQETQVEALAEVL